MNLKEEVFEMEKEVKKIQEESLAMSLLKDYKKVNKRMFIIILVILGMFACLLGYTIWLLNDVGTETTTTEEIIDIDDVDVDNIENSHIHNR